MKGRVFADLFAAPDEPLYQTILKHHMLNLGVSRGQKLKHYIQLSGSTSTETELWNDCHARMLEAVGASPWVSGFEFFLNALRNAAVELAVVTAMPSNDARNLLENNGLDWLAAHVNGGEEKSTRLKKLGKSQSSGHSCCYFGDQLSDLDAAKRAGWDFIGVTGSALSDQRLTQKAVTIRDFTEIIYERRC